MKRIISLLLIVTTLFTTFAVNVSAASNEEFISEVALVYEDSIEEAKAAIAGTDWKLLEYDLNPNADAMFDDGVYLIYKTSTNVEDAITDLRVMDMYGGYSTANYEKQLEASRNAYMKAVSYLRITAAEFKTLYEAGDEMAKLAYRQMNYYKDSDTNLLMGDFMLNIPSDDALVTVLMEGNGYAVTNLISLLAIGISGGNNGTLAERITANYEKRDTFINSIEYYNVASMFSDEFAEFAAIVKRYNALADQYDLTDEDISEEEADFLINYASVALTLDAIPYGEGTLKDFVVKEDLTVQDLCPIIAAFTEGQLALSDIGVLTTVLQYSSPSASIEQLYKVLEETEKALTDENGNLKIFDVYTGVDRSIFDGDFAFTTAAERQQALTGMEWSASQSVDDAVPYELIKNMTISGAAIAVGPIVAAKILLKLVASFGFGGHSGTVLNSFGYVGAKVLSFICGTKNGVIISIGKGGLTKAGLVAGVGLLLVALGVTGISAWYGYYNPDYTPIPNNLIDVKETDIGDKYVKYTAAKVFEEGKLSEKNADLNAYEGKEWNALYYTKDATAGNCLTPKFVYSESNSTIARRHQGISMFGETEAFNLNSHVYNDDAPGVYVTIRYSTTKKAAADVPSVVGSMFGGAFYVLTAFAGAGLGVGGTLLVQKAKKKKDEAEPSEVN